MRVYAALGEKRGSFSLTGNVSVRFWNYKSTEQTMSGLCAGKVNSDLTLQNSIENTVQNYCSLAAKVIASRGNSSKPLDQKTEVNNALTNNQIKTEDTDTVTDTKPDFRPYPLKQENTIPPLIIIITFR